MPVLLDELVTVPVSIAPSCVPQSTEEQFAGGVCPGTDAPVSSSWL